MKNKSKSLILYIIIFIIIGIVLAIYKGLNFHKYYSDIKTESLGITQGEQYTNENDIKLTVDEKEILVKCDIFKKSDNIAETFKNQYKSEFTGTGKTDAENKLYDIVVTYIKEGKKYQDFESELFTILGGADGDEAKPLRLQINFIYKFFYSQNFNEEFECDELVK